MLREMDFLDLYIAESGACSIHHLSGGKGPLIDVPLNAISDLDALHKRVCSEGQSKDEFALDFDNVRYRVSKIAGQTGISYALRRLAWPIPRMLSLGFPKAVYSEIGRLGVRPSRGLLLIAGATGQGKTTTASSILQEYLIQFGDVAVTVEDPPELPLEGKYGKFGRCYQTRVENGDFVNPVRASMRFSPRYIFVGEIRDPGGAAEAIRAANSGHVVLATIHGGTIQEAITSILKLVSSELDLELARQMLSDGLAAVVHQEMKFYPGADGGTERRLRFQTLFINGDPGIKSLIRTGKTEQLSTNIERQAERVAKSKSPIAQPGERT